MKTMIIFLKLLLPLGLMAFLFQGCYTQLMTTHEEDSYYQPDQQSAGQSDSNYYDENNDNWQSHQNLGFSYYYPSWQSYWSWDYGCVYPSYWDPWYWGPAFYVGYSYYPHYWGYGGRYWGYNGHSYNSRSYMTRNFGYQRGGNNRQTYGAARSGNTGTGSMYNGQTGTNRRDILLRSAGSTRTTRTSRGVSTGISTNRQSSSGRYNPSIQQPRHRDQSTTTINRNYRMGSPRGSGHYRSQGSNNGQIRTSGRSSAPSYSPQPSSRTSSGSSSSAPRNDGGSGGGRQSGGSGRSR
jgi:hypothetical protein